MSFMSPKPPPPVAPPPPVTVQKPGADPQVAADAAKKMADSQQAERAQRGKASTLLTGSGGTGDPTAAPTAKRTLLGG